jgi:hypothetical protein
MKYIVALLAEVEAETFEKARKIVYENVDIDIPGSGVEYILADDSRTAKSGERIVILPAVNNK